MFIQNKHEMLIKIKAITSFFQHNASGYVFDPCFSILALFTRCKNMLAFKLDVRDFKIQRRGRQRERQKNNRFYKQNNNFARASRFLYISLPVFARVRRKNA